MNKNTKVIIGMVLVVIGIGLLLYGNSQNNDFGAVMGSYFSGGGDPGTPWMVFGGILIAVGIIVALVAISSSNNGSNASVDTRKCPFCGNEIKLEAIICQYCKKDVPVADNKYTVITPAPIKNGPDPTSPDKVILSIGDVVYFQNELENCPGWYYVKSLKAEGWCLAENLKKG